MEIEIIPAGFLMLRTPSLPFDELIKWSDGLTAATTNINGLSEALKQDKQLLRARLRGILARPEILEALFNASPDLVEMIARWQREPESEKGLRIERSLVRYLLRMASRPTPFGLFAAISVGVTGKETKLQLVDRSQYQRHTRLDMNYIYSLTERLEQDRALREKLLLFPNSTIYRTPGKFRYVETKEINKERNYFVVALEASEYLEKTLARARTGATLKSLAEALAQDDEEILIEEAREYIHDLIDNNILVTDLIPAITGPEPTDTLIAQFRKLNLNQFADRLSQVQNRLKEFDENGVAIDPSDYRDTAHLLDDLPVTVNLKKLFQIDMIAPAENLTLGEKIINELKVAVEIMASLMGGGIRYDLQMFRKAFKERYGEGDRKSVV